MRRLSIIFIIAFIVPVFCHAATKKPSFNHQINQLINIHYNTYKDIEYFSAIQTSIYIPGRKIENFQFGKVSREMNASAITENNLFQIGSITKSFTAALILKLQEDKKLHLSDKLRKWLPQYPLWSDITIKQLLNMTSGLPNYSDTPSWNYLESKNLSLVWNNQDLIKFVYPNSNNFNPPLKQGYFYTNTGYLLLDMIMQKASKKSFNDLLNSIILKPHKLHNTQYPIPHYRSQTLESLVHGYNYNQYDNPILVGQDVTKNNLTWAAAAGAIVANSEDVVKWVKLLFIDNALLDKYQKQLLMSMISLQTGDPIDTTNAAEPKGFGLGVIGAYNKDIGNYWYYEGETLGFRALYIYVPCNNVIITSLFNSAVNSENDHAHELVVGIYKTILKNYPNLSCQQSSS